MKNQLDNLQLQGSKRKKAEEGFASQLDEWGLKMPSIKPLIWDFGLGEFDNVGLIEYWISNEMGAGYCGKYLFVFDGQQCPLHSHQKKHETFMVVKGKIRMVVDNKSQIMEEGAVLSMPPGQKDSFTGIGNSLVLEISTSCLVSDNLFQDPPIAAWLKNILK